MSKTLAVIVIILVIAGGAFYFLAPDSMKFWQRSVETPISNDGKNNTPIDNEPLETINAKHQYKNGVHIIAGEIDIPTPCHILTTETRVAESYPEQVTISFVTKTNAEMCIQVITAARFKVEFQASEAASIKATLNGRPVILNLIHASPNENLEDFEIYIKG